MSLTGDSSANQIALNCAPALSNDQTTVYVAVSTGAEFGTGYLTSLNAATLAPIAHAALFDPRGALAIVSTDSSAAPMVGPGWRCLLRSSRNPCCSSHNDRGWLLHFDSALTQTKTPGSFGWDDTASVVPANCGAVIHRRIALSDPDEVQQLCRIGSGDGVNKVAVLDPSAPCRMSTRARPVTVMQEVITVTGVTPDPAARPAGRRERVVHQYRGDRPLHEIGHHQQRRRRGVPLGLHALTRCCKRCV